MAFPQPGHFQVSVTRSMVPASTRATVATGPARNARASSTWWFGPDSRPRVLAPDLVSMTQIPLDFSASVSQRSRRVPVEEAQAHLFVEPANLDVHLHSPYE